MLDLISRQAAIDTAAEYEKQLCEMLCDENELVETVKILKHRLIALPSAQPEIVRCKDCKHWEYDVIFADGWCRGKQQGNPEWFCADAERRTDG